MSDNVILLLLAICLSKSAGMFDITASWNKFIRKGTLWKIYEEMQLQFLAL